MFNLIWADYVMVVKGNGLIPMSQMGQVFERMSWTHEDVSLFLPLSLILFDTLPPPLHPECGIKPSPRFHVPRLQWKTQTGHPMPSEPRHPGLYSVDCSVANTMRPIDSAKTCNSECPFSGNYAGTGQVKGIVVTVEVSWLHMHVQT